MQLVDIRRDHLDRTVLTPLEAEQPHFRGDLAGQVIAQRS